MSLEQKINYQLNKVPGVKKVIKRVYQQTMYALSPKIKSEGDIVRISPNDSAHEYFFAIMTSLRGMQPIVICFA